MAAGPPVSGTSQAPDGALQIVAALLRNPPEVFSDLETLAGPIGRDRSHFDEAFGPIARARATGPLAGLRVALAIDFYHEDPHEVENPKLASYDLHFRHDGRACRELLRTVADPPQQLLDGGIGVLRFKDFYFREAGSEDGFTLSWYLDEPDFAIPRRTAEETKRLVDGLVGLLRHGISRAAIEQRFGALTPDPVWQGVDVLKGPDWELKVKPGKGQAVKEVSFFTRRPIPGEALVQALQLKEPGVIMWCIHPCSFTVIDLAVPGEPVAHGYMIRIELAQKADLVAVDRPLYPGSVFLARDYPVEEVEFLRP